LNDAKNENGLDANRTGDCPGTMRNIQQPMRGLKKKKSKRKILKGRWRRSDLT